jgi:hypothetical protein
MSEVAKTGAITGTLPAIDDASAGASTQRKVSLRLLPVIGIGYGLAYMDRVNISFASLQMNRDLHFSATVYGVGAGLFFIGYALCEVPSNLLLLRFGARRWLARVMFTWIAGGGDDVRAHAAPIQCAAVSAGRGGSRVFSRSALLPDVVVSGPYAGARGQPVLHCAAARVDGDGCASRMAFGPRRQVRPGWLAMAVSSGRIAVRVVQPGDTEVAAGRAAERDVADG